MKKKHLHLNQGYYIFTYQKILLLCALQLFHKFTKKTENINDNIRLQKWSHHY